MKFINKIKREPHLIEFIRFCIVGALCTGIDAVIFYAVGLFTCYQIALITGYCTSLMINYFLTVYWTFRTQPSKKNLGGVVAAHLFNLFIVRIGLMWMFIHWCGLSDNIAYIPTLAISVIINFFLVKLAMKI